MFEFIKKLGTEKLDHLFVPVLKRRINNLKRAADIEQFINVLTKIKPIANDDLVKIYQALDGKLIVNEKGSTKVALTLQEKKPQGAVCIRSAHLYALEVLDDKQQRSQIIGIYNKLETQGLPSEKNVEYIQDLIEKLFKALLTQDELIYLIKLFASVKEYITELVNAILEFTTPKRIGEWNILIDVVMETKNKATYDAIVSDCAKLKHGEKALDQLYEILDSDERRIYFVQIKDEALEIIRSKKPQSFLGKLFTKPNDKNSESHRKK
jgi:hypothetical protein